MYADELLALTEAALSGNRKEAAEITERVIRSYRCLQNPALAARMEALLIKYGFRSPENSGIPAGNGNSQD